MILGIIPARYASTRFPGKPLIDIQGKSMIQRVYGQAMKAKSLKKVIVATDDERIAHHVKRFGGEYVMTRPDHVTGTDRCFEALQNSGGNYKYVINIQGDEPFIDPSQINLLADTLTDGNTELATLVIPVDSHELLFNEGEVKVTVNNKMEALYFSRSVIPHIKNVDPKEWHQHFNYYRHVGMYAYRSDLLEELTNLKPSALEKAESLEQLRWLENGFKIKVAVTTHDSHCIDTPEDVGRVLRMMGGK
ncbi:MAG: 3-deoxy-manno-octulosonate cytidylyltransferase [Bacteroidetes bacterium]|nr:3-deoxy-manno-octulosonate cytidylyltransferase [Bacteroidota bacterium]